MSGLKIKKVTITVYECTDGMEFVDFEAAKIHQKLIDKQEKVVAKKKQKDKRDEEYYNYMYNLIFDYMNPDIPKEK